MYWTYAICRVRGDDGESLSPAWVRASAEQDGT